MGLKNTTACYGFQQITATSTSVGLTVPAAPSSSPTAATYAIIQAEAQALRWRDDGTAPTTTVGMTIPAGGELRYDGDLSKFRMIAATAGAIANVSFYG